MNRYSSPWPQYVAGSMNALNPYPVWSFSDAWDALENVNVCLDCIAQVGFEHAYAVSNYAVVFMQWTDNNGNFSPIHYGETITTDNTNYSFKVIRIFTNGGAPAGYDFQWWGIGPSPHSYSTQTSITWGPDTIEASGEVGDYSSTNNTGSHVVGNKITNINVTGVQWIDQNKNTHYGGLNNWTSGNFGGLATPYQYLTVIDSGDFNIWDNHCQ